MFVILNFLFLVKYILGKEIKLYFNYFTISYTYANAHTDCYINGNFPKYSIFLLFFIKINLSSFLLWVLKISIRQNTEIEILPLAPQSRIFISLEDVSQQEGAGSRGESAEMVTVFCMSCNVIHSLGPSLFPDL